MGSCSGVSGKPFFFHRDDLDGNELRSAYSSSVGAFRSALANFDRPGRILSLLRYTNAETVTQVTCPAFVTDNETDTVSTGQGRILFDHLTCPKEFRLFTKAEGAEGHCEGMAPVVFWDAAFNWLDSLLSS